MNLDAGTCYEALRARDARFDGLFFVGVATTGIYCRPVCRARTPGRDRCAFYRSAAEAEEASFRACFRCRPELSPGLGPVDALPRLAAAAVARIEEGFLDDASVDDLAATLGVTARHLRRATIAGLGVSPIALAAAQRTALAKQLLQDTALPIAEVAFASGFSSVRRFNALFRERFGKAPSSFRRATGGATGRESVTLRLDYRPPFDWEELLGFLAGRAIPGVEVIDGGVYRRTVRLGARTGWVSVTRDPARDALRAEVSLSLVGAILPVRAALRALFDLDAQPAAIAACLGRDPDLGPLVRRRPGLRIPGAFDPFECAVRAVLGQQVSVRAATTLSGRVAAALGAPIATPFPGLDRVFPTAAILAACDEGTIASLGMPGARARALLGMAAAFAGGSIALPRGGDPEAATARLVALPGIGPWTAEYLAMRALGWPDAFPASDLGVRKALGGLAPRAAIARAEAWRPFRAYAVMHLWMNLSDGDPR